MNIVKSTGTQVLPATINLPGNNFAGEKQAALLKPFTFSVYNNTGSPQTVYLTPSYVPTAANRVITDGAIVYATGQTNLTAQSLVAHTIAEFLEWIKFHPTRVSQLQITTDTVQQLQSQLSIQRKVLFGNPAPELLNLSSFTSPTFQNDKMIIVEHPDWQLDYDTEISLIIPGTGGSGAPVSCTTTFAFYFGAHIDTPGSLRKVAQAARS